MQAKRFIAADMRRALDMVKQEFGEDAMILSTERTKKGVELVATTEAPIEHSLQQPQATVETVASANRAAPSLQQGTVTHGSATNNTVTSSSFMNNMETNNTNDSAVGLASGKTKAQLAQEMDMANRKMMAARKAESLTIGQWAEQENAKTLEQNNIHAAQQRLLAEDHYSKSATDNISAIRNEEEIRQLHNEISSMRSTIEIQLAQMAESQERQFQNAQHREEQYREEQYQQDQHRDEQFREEFREGFYKNEKRYGETPSSSNQTDILSQHIRQRLDAIGLTKPCSDRLLTSLNELEEDSPSEQKIWTKLLTSLSKRIPHTVADPIAQGGVYAFLGTTGVGKTTTIAKLAARYVMENGSNNVVLLTTDNYRIASHNQLRTLGKILNIKVRVVEDLMHLPAMVDEYKDVPLVLIDTPGMSVSDPLLKPHLQALKQCRGIQNLLVLSASSQYQMMKASLHSYRVAGLKYCVMTKLDECASLGDAISVMTDHQLPLAYITDGQSVPDDIDVLKATQLVSRAVAASKEGDARQQQARW